MIFRRQVFTDLQGKEASFVLCTACGLRMLGARRTFSGSDTIIINSCRFKCRVFQVVVWVELRVCIGDKRE
jgi:hypothetical protein